jgi:hypothetical protein
MATSEAARRVGRGNLEESSLPEGSLFFAKPYSENDITDRMAALLSSDSGLSAS